LNRAASHFRLVSIIFSMAIVGMASQTFGASGQGSIFEQNCGKKESGYACPQCEDDLNTEFTALIDRYLQTPIANPSRWAETEATDAHKLRPNTKAEDFISDSIRLLARTNPPDGRVNFIPVGKSESLHDTSVGNPRILLKSPNAELWVSYNTDPKSYAYQKVEIMRWDGKRAKFLFQELDFSTGKEGRHANLSGKVCATCHKDPARPIWDTYRAWPGVMHPRDDMVEADNPDQGGWPDAAARDYLRFLQRIAAAKDNPNGVDRRLAELDIPSTFTGTPRQQISQIETQVKTQGWYRVPHFPTAHEVKNWDEKTAELAGPSHLTFDQFLGQQMCQVGTQMKTPKMAFERLKYAVTGILKCLPPSSVDPTLLGKFLPVTMTTPIDLYFANPNRRYNSQGTVDWAPAVGSPNTTLALKKSLAMLPILFKNTLQWNSDEASHKADLERFYLTDVLTEIEHLDATTAAKEARFIAEEKVASVVRRYHAIRDPGGVRGVAEAAPGTVANLRYLLEPIGFPVEAWSTSRGNAPAMGRSYGFSDQFLPFLVKQNIFEDVFRSAPGSTTAEKCDSLMNLSTKALENQFFHLRADVVSAHLVHKDDGSNYGRAPSSNNSVGVNEGTPVASTAHALRAPKLIGVIKYLVPFKKSIQRMPASPFVYDGEYIYGCSFSGEPSAGAQPLMTFPLPTTKIGEVHDLQIESNRELTLKVGINSQGLLSVSHSETDDPSRELVFSSRIEGFNQSKKSFPKFSFEFSPPAKHSKSRLFKLECQ
jgi:hypothetical protein